MLKTISSALYGFFYGGYNPQAAISSNGSPSHAESEVPKYPPIDQGISVQHPESLLESQSALVDRIKKTSGLPPDVFDTLYIPVLLNLAKYVHLLPATRTGHHRGAGGLFRLSLEIGLYSLQAANSTIFVSKGTVSAEARFKQHPRWVYSTFIAGVCSELYRPISDMIVTDENGKKWPQFMHTLYDWAVMNNCRRYFISWNVQDEIDVVAAHQASAAFILNSIIPQLGLQYLNEENNEIISTMSACITNLVPIGVRNQVHQIITIVRKKVVERDLKSNSERYGDFTVGSHLEPYLIDAMRRLLKKKVWDINSKGARIWSSSEGVFIVWQPAAKEILNIMTDDNQPGIPSDADTLADILINCGIIEETGSDGRYWDICIPTSMQFLPAVKLQRVELLFADNNEIPKVEDYLLAENLNKKSSKKNDEQNSKQNEPKASTTTHADKSNDTQVSATGDNEETSVKEPKETEISFQEEPTEAVSVVKQPPAIPKFPSMLSSKMEERLANLVKSETKSALYLKTQKSQEKTPTILDEAAETVLASMPKDASEYMRAILEDHIKGCSDGPVFSTIDGIAISVKELESHGQTNFISLVNTLSNKSWLWTDPNKPMKKLIDIDHNSSKLKVIVIKKAIAQTMGFKWKQPKK